MIVINFLAKLLKTYFAIKYAYFKMVNMKYSTNKTVSVYVLIFFINIGKEGVYIEEIKLL